MKRTVTVAAAIGVLVAAVASGPADAQTDAATPVREEYRIEWSEVRPQTFADADLPKDAPGPVIQLAAGPEAMVAAYGCAHPCLELLRSTDGTEWQSVSIDGPGRRISALTWTGDAFLALVHAGGTLHPDVRKRPARDRRSCLDAWCRTGSDWYVYHSSDALEWDRIEVGKTKPRDDLGAVSDGDGLVIGGCVLSKRNPFPSVFGGRMNACQRAVILTSADGETWERLEVKDARWFGDVASDGSTTVVAGFRGEAADDSGGIGLGQPVIMTRTPDGRWSEPRRLLRPGSHPPDLARAPQGGFLLSASGFCDSRHLYDAAHRWLLASADGLEWRSLRPCPRTSVKDRPTSLGVVSGQGIAASIGFDGTGEITTWWSDDGTSWYQQTGGTPSGFPDDYIISADGWLLVVSQAERAFWLGRLVPADETAPIDTAGASRRDLENALLDRVWPIECRRWRRGDEPFRYGARAAIQCDEPTSGIGQLALFTFPDTKALRDFWSWRVGQLALAPVTDDPGCDDGQDGAASVEHGEVACYVQRGVAKIRWTDERTMTYGVLDARDRDLGRLYEWWHGNDASRIRTPTGTQSDDVEPAISANHDGRLEYLLERASRPRRCKPMPASETARLAPEAVAGIACRPTKRELEDYELYELAYYLFPSSDAMAEWWTRTRETVPHLDPNGKRLADDGLEPDSGSFSTCAKISYGTDDTNIGETGWTRRDRADRGRMACWRPPPRCERNSCPILEAFAWTGNESLIGGLAVAGPDYVSWFEKTFPDRRQAYPDPLPGAAAHAPFVDPASIRPLPRSLTQVHRGENSQRFKPLTLRGLPVGVPFPLAKGHCDGLAGPIDIDGNWWAAVGGTNLNGRRIKRSAREEQYDRDLPTGAASAEGSRYEFMKTSHDEAQVRTANGFVIAYERQYGPIRIRGCA